MQQWTISQLDCDVQQKVDFIQQAAKTSSVIGLRRSSKYFPKPNLCQKRSWPLFGGLLPVLSTAAAAKSLQLCPTLCDPIDSSPPGSPVPGILLARTLEWVAISISNVWKWKVKVKSLSCVWLLATPWTATYQAPPSVGFSRQEYWSGVPLLFLVLSTTGS